jgi:hypothetical protein
MSLKTHQEVQGEIHAVFNCHLAPVTALREEYTGLFACLPVGLRDLHRFAVSIGMTLAVASFVSKLMGVCEGAQLF